MPRVVEHFWVHGIVSSTLDHLLRSGDETGMKRTQDFFKFGIEGALEEADEMNQQRPGMAEDMITTGIRGINQAPERSAQMREQYEFFCREVVGPLLHQRG